MGERPQNRQAMENVVKRITDHERAQGREVSESSARKQAAEIARQQDNKREGGAFKKGSRR